MWAYNSIYLMINNHLHTNRLIWTCWSLLQEVEYVKAEAKLVYLLECLQKTAPPVLVFAEKTADVDNIHEYLLVKGVEAVAVHGGKDQEEREAAIDAFKVRPAPC